MQLRLTAVALLSLLGACLTDPVTPGTNIATEEGVTLSPMSLAQVQTEMTQAASPLSPGAPAGLRIGVRIKPGSSPMVASELFLDPPSLASQPEEIQANIVSLDLTTGGGTITTNIGGLKVTFDGTTALSKDETDAALSLEQFSASIATALAAGQKPHLVARRAPPAVPQSPTDGDFLADHIRLAGSDAMKIDMNAAKENLELNTAPPPDAFLKLLNVTIHVRVSDGTTKIGHRSEQPGVKKVDFDGEVKSVSLGEGSFKLANGTVIKVNNQTVIAPVEHLGTLAEVAAALNNGATVKTMGSGILTSEAPRVVTALALKFESRPQVLEFQEGVKAVAMDGKKLVLTNGAVLCYNDQTEVSAEGDFTSFTAVAAGLAAGKIIGAAGYGTPAPESAGCRAVILKVRFTLRAPPPPAVTEFTDLVKSVDVAGRKMLLGIGVVICFNDGSQINQEGLKTLAEVASALAAGKIVTAAGSAAATPAGSECRAMVVKVKFTAATPPPVTTEFHEGIKSVNTGAKTIVLSNDVVLCVNGETVFNPEGALKSLAEVASALEAGKKVKADGTASPAAASAVCRGLVLRVKLSIVT